jgi:hypothetical protein
MDSTWIFDFFFGIIQFIIFFGVIYFIYWKMKHGDIRQKIENSNMPKDKKSEALRYIDNNQIDNKEAFKRIGKMFFIFLVGVPGMFFTFFISISLTKNSILSALITFILMAFFMLKFAGRLIKSLLGEKDYHTLRSSLPKVLPGNDYAPTGVKKTAHTVGSILAFISWFPVVIIVAIIIGGIVMMAGSTILGIIAALLVIIVYLLYIIRRYERTKDEYKSQLAKMPKIH